MKKSLRTNSERLLICWGGWRDQKFCDTSSEASWIIQKQKLDIYYPTSARVVAKSVITPLVDNPRAFALTSPAGLKLCWNRNRNLQWKNSSTNWFLSMFTWWTFKTKAEIDFVAFNFAVMFFLSTHEINLCFSNIVKFTTQSCKPLDLISRRSSSAYPAHKY